MTKKTAARVSCAGSHGHEGIEPTARQQRRTHARPKRTHHGGAAHGEGLRAKNQPSHERAARETLGADAKGGKDPPDTKSDQQGASHHSSHSADAEQGGTKIKRRAEAASKSAQRNIRGKPPTVVKRLQRPGPPSIVLHRGKSHKRPTHARAVQTAEQTCDQDRQVEFHHDPVPAV